MKTFRQYLKGAVPQGFDIYLAFAKWFKDEFLVVDRGYSLTMDKYHFDNPERIKGYLDIVGSSYNLSQKPSGIFMLELRIKVSSLARSIPFYQVISPHTANRLPVVAFYNNTFRQFDDWKLNGIVLESLRQQSESFIDYIDGNEQFKDFSFNDFIPLYEPVAEVSNIIEA